MRVALVLALLFPWPARAAASDEPGVDPRLPDEPGLARDAITSPATRGGLWQRRPRGPRLKLGYRTFAVGEMGDRSARYHCFDVDVYLYSGYVRGALGLEGGVEDSPRDNFVLSGVISAGVQYPARVTPFLDFTSSVGALRRDILDQDLVNLAYSFGLEGGADVFIYRSVLVSLALGWRRQVFRHGGDDQVEAVDVYFDSFTLRIGLGF